MSGAEDGSVYFSRLLEYVEGGEVNSVDAFKEGGTGEFILNSLCLTSKVINYYYIIKKLSIIKIQNIFIKY
jgi:hypothetical protein